jgi:hypothetical protein
MTHRYEFARAAGEKGLVLIFAEDAFESLPFEVRLSAPWAGRFYGEVGELKPSDRQQLQHAGYLILREAELSAPQAATMHPAARNAANGMLRQAA